MYNELRNILHKLQSRIQIEDEITEEAGIIRKINIKELYTHYTSLYFSRPLEFLYNIHRQCNGNGSQSKMIIAYDDNDIIIHHMYPVVLFEELLPTGKYIYYFVFCDNHKQVNISCPCSESDIYDDLSKTFEKILHCNSILDLSLYTIDNTLVRFNKSTYKCWTDIISCITGATEPIEGVEESKDDDVSSCNQKILSSTNLDDNINNMDSPLKLLSIKCIYHTIKSSIIIMNLKVLQSKWTVITITGSAMSFDHLSTDEKLFISCCDNVSFEGMLEYILGKEVGIEKDPEASIENLLKFMKEVETNIKNICTLIMDKLENWETEAEYIIKNGNKGDKR